MARKHCVSPLCGSLTWPIRTSVGVARKRVLFVDDDVVTLRSLERFMMRFPQMHSTFVRTPAHALELLGLEQFDIVVVDYLMPAMTGDHLFAIVARDQPAAFRIMISGTSPHDLETNAHVLLDKPVEPRQLQALLVRHG